jgi:hypothetical protein
MKALLFALAASSLTAGGFAPVDRHLGPPPGEACARLGQQAVAPDGVRIFKKLNELPWGVMEHAVWRTVGGCPVREIVFGGQTYYVASASPRVERLDPVAHQPLEKRFSF